MPIDYKTNASIPLDQIIDLYDDSGLGKRRPTQDPQHMAQMMQHANLIISAWDEDLLVGISRSFTDYAYVTYLSDLAVRKKYQSHGIGKKLIHLTQLQAGPNASLILNAAPEAQDYYPRLGFTQLPQCWCLPAADKLDMFRSMGLTTRTQWEFDNN